MLNGLDLFSGIAGISLALRDYVKTVAFCEIDPYCQGVLLSRMASDDIDNAPIWDDIKNLDGNQFKGCCDIIFGGFPCQDISCAGAGKGLAGERSGLFFEIVRLAKEIVPKWIFLENVPAITSRGGIQVLEELAKMGYNARWLVISAASVGALHRRERFFLLAHSQHNGSHGTKERRSVETSIHDHPEESLSTKQSTRSDQPRMLAGQPISNPGSKGLEGQGNRTGSASPEKPKPSGLPSNDASDTAGLRCNKGAGERIQPKGQAKQYAESSDNSSALLNFWENTEPPVCGVANGLPFRVDQIRALGNSVCPQQTKEAFEILMGLK